MRVLVCGGRNYNDVDAVYMFLDGLPHNYIEGPITEIISGVANGADTIAVQYAKERGIPLKAFPAAWATGGRAAGPMRNQKMLVEGKPDYVVAFPGGRGTSDMVYRAKQAKIPVFEVRN